MHDKQKFGRGSAMELACDALRPSAMFQETIAEAVAQSVTKILLAIASTELAFQDRETLSRAATSEGNERREFHLCDPSVFRNIE